MPGPMSQYYGKGTMRDKPESQELWRQSQRWYAMSPREREKQRKLWEKTKDKKPEDRKGGTRPDPFSKAFGMTDQERKLMDTMITTLLIPRLNDASLYAQPAAPRPGNPDLKGVLTDPVYN